MNKIYESFSLSIGLIIIAYVIAFVISGGIAPYPATVTFYNITTLKIFGMIKAVCYFTAGFIFSILGGQKATWIDTRTDITDILRARFLLFLLIVISSIFFSLGGVLLFGGMWHLTSTILLALVCIIGICAIIYRHWIIMK